MFTILTFLFLPTALGDLAQRRYELIHTWYFLKNEHHLEKASHGNPKSEQTSLMWCHSLNSDQFFHFWAKLCQFFTLANLRCGGASATCVSVSDNRFDFWAPRYESVSLWIKASVKQLFFYFTYIHWSFLAIKSGTDVWFGEKTTTKKFTFFKATNFIYDL